MRSSDFIQNIKNEFVNWNRWRDRIVVMIFAVLTGLLVVAFTKLSELALNQFHAWVKLADWMVFVLTPLICASVVWVTQKYFASSAGSGIPQVIAALSSQTPAAQRGFFVSFKLSLAKIFLTTTGLLGGLSLGREGPSVQIAAGMMRNARHWLSEHSQIKESGLILVGGAAGIAAAFNTPLAGVMFAIEELSKHPEDRRNGILITAIVMSGMVAISIDGNATYFGQIRDAWMSWNMFFPAIVVALVSGICGGLFSKIMIASLNPTGQFLAGVWRKKHPVWFAAGLGLLIACIGFWSSGTTFGSGYSYTKAMLENQSEVSFYYPILKMLATWLTSWSGVPGGIFAPSLAVGAALGNDVAMLMQVVNAPTLIALGMAAFLAAVTQAPLTSFIIVMEMVSGHELVLSLMFAALLASAISRVISRPLYSSLAVFQLRRLQKASR
jgi:H+/Cl- antiporter ClcA